MRTRAALALMVPAAGGTLACGCLLSIDESRLDASAGDATAGGDALGVDAATDAADAPSTADVQDTGAAQGDGAIDADGAPAEAGCPPAMVEVPGPGGTPSFCVDATEVTNGAYKQFLAAAEPPAAGSQPAVCAWNTTFQPGGALGADDHPVGSVDWCDARGFCEWAGKHLCGAVGGGSLDPAAYLGAPSGRWFDACSRGGAQAYPYGSAYLPMACNGAPRGVGDTVAVGSLASCEGGYPGLFDMTGNVSEFIDSCFSSPDPGCGTTGPECDVCLLVGGGFLSGADGGANIACGYANQVYRQSHYVDNGLRCCADKP